jgi:hypothetical protein
LLAKSHPLAPRPTTNRERRDLFLPRLRNYVAEKPFAQNTVKICTIPNGLFFIPLANINEIISVPGWQPITFCILKIIHSFEEA